MMSVPSRLATLSAAAAVLASACGGSGVHDVTVVHVSSRAITAHPGGQGKVSAGIDVPVTLDFKDTITAIHVKAGDKVTKGQPLFDLDPTPLATNVQALQLRLDGAVAALQKAQASLAVAQARNSPLVPGLQAQIQVLQGQITFDQQLVDIAHGRTAAVNAPIDGLILAINVQPGVAAPPGTPLAEVVDFTRITVTANLPVGDQPDVQPGAVAVISFPDFPDVNGGSGISGNVTTVSAGTTASGASFQVTVDAANTADRLIRPGLNAYVRVLVRHQAGLTLPRAAVLNIDLDPTVMVVFAQVAHRQPVQIGIADDNYVQIVKGVQAQDACVIVGNQPLDDGSPVRITKDEG